MMLSTLLGRAVWPRKSNAVVTSPRSLGDRCPTVSVVIPCYNYGHYLPQCIQSVLDQQGVSLNIVVIDDASSDGSTEIVRNLPELDPRIRVICHATNQGHIATIGEAMTVGDGDYTVLLSADDLLTPGCLARSAALMEEHPSVGLTYGFPIVFSDAELPPARTVATRWIIWPGHNWISSLCRTGRNVLRSPEAMIRTSVLRQIGQGRPELPHSADFEFWMRAAAISDIGYVGGADQAYYRAHENNMHYSYGLLDDVTARLGAFDALFAERAHLLPAASEMRRVAHRTLALDALGHGIGAYARGAADSEPIEEFAAFAVDAWPDVKNSGEWRTLCRLRDGKAGKSGRDLSLTARAKVRDLRYSVLWWRQRWTGV